MFAMVINQQLTKVAASRKTEILHENIYWGAHWKRLKQDNGFMGNLLLIPLTVYIGLDKQNV